MKKTPKGQVLLLELEMVGSPCRRVRNDTGLNTYVVMMKAGESHAA